MALVETAAEAAARMAQERAKALPEASREAMKQARADKLQQVGAGLSKVGGGTPPPGTPPAGIGRQNLEAFMELLEAKRRRMGRA